MARQAKDQTVIQFVGIDPGEVHCGWARLRVTDVSFVVTLGTHSVADFAFSSLVDVLVPESINYVGVEEYRARPLGHQAFSAGYTAQLIGGIKYRCSSLEAISMAMIPAADPKKELPKYKLELLTHAIMATCVQRSNPRWQHGLSAFRVLAAILMKHNHSMLHELGLKKNVLRAALDAESHCYDGDLRSGILTIPRI